MKKIATSFTKMIHVAMVLSLILMFVFILGNVILRYAFGSGIPWASELSRYLFVWMVFLGIMMGVKENTHLSVDMFVKRLPLKIRKVIYLVGAFIMLGILILFLQGSIGMTLTTTDTISPATRIPLSYIYGIGIVASVGMIIFIFRNSWVIMRHKDGFERLSPNGTVEEHDPSLGDIQNKGRE